MMMVTDHIIIQLQQQHQHPLWIGAKRIHAASHTFTTSSLSSVVSPLLPTLFTTPVCCLFCGRTFCTGGIHRGGSGIFWKDASTPEGFHGQNPARGCGIWLKQNVKSVYNFNVFLCEIWKTEGSNSNQKTLNSIVHLETRNTHHTKSLPRHATWKLYLCLYMCVMMMTVCLFTTHSVFVLCSRVPQSHQLQMVSIRRSRGHRNCCQFRHFQGRLLTVLRAPLSAQFGRQGAVVAGACGALYRHQFYVFHCQLNFG